MYEARTRRMRQTAAAMVAAGALAALASIGSMGNPVTAAPAAFFCAPVAPAFGIYADELHQQQQQALVPADAGCHGDSGPEAANSQNAHPLSSQMTQLAAHQQAQPGSGEDVWLQVFEAEAHDHAE